MKISSDDKNRYRAFRRGRLKAEEPIPTIEEYLEGRANGSIKRGGYHPGRDAWGRTDDDKRHVKNVVNRINKKAMGLV